jgi:elongation factor G
VLDGNQGVEPQTETVWRQAENTRAARVRQQETRSARLFPPRRRDNTKAGGRPIVSSCLGSVPSSNFRGVIDLLRMKAGARGTKVSAPHHEKRSWADRSEGRRVPQHILIEAAVEGWMTMSEALYLDGRSPTAEGP